MTGVLTRAYAVDLEIREDGRTLVGVAVPYGVETRIGSYTESFAAGAFANVDPAAVPLTAMHPDGPEQLPIGISTELREEVDGLHGAWRVSDTAFGNDVLTLVRDGALTGLSIGFVPGTDRWTADRTRVVRGPGAVLDHVALVRSPAYPDARVGAVRGAQADAALLRLALRRVS